MVGTRLVDVHAGHKLGGDDALAAQRPDDVRHIDRASEARVCIDQLPETHLAARLMAVVALKRQLLFGDLPQRTWQVNTRSAEGSRLDSALLASASFVARKE